MEAKLVTMWEPRGGTGSRRLRESGGCPWLVKNRTTTSLRNLIPPVVLSLALPGQASTTSARGLTECPLSPSLIRRLWKKGKTHRIRPAIGSTCHRRVSTTVKPILVNLCVGLRCLLGPLPSRVAKAIQRGADLCHRWRRCIQQRKTGRRIGGWCSWPAPLK